MSSGLVTKGLISGGGETVTSVETPSSPEDIINSVGGSAFAGTITIVVPTAINVCLMAAENIVDNLRVRQAADLTLPSLYKRAFLVAHETDEIAVVKG